LLAEVPTEKKMNKADGKQPHTIHRRARADVRRPRAGVRSLANTITLAPCCCRYVMLL
jgi:hypothetical protein